MIVGHGDYRYELEVGWGQGPQGRVLGVASGVAVDAQDRVYVVDREPHPGVTTQATPSTGCGMKGLPIKAL